MMALKLLKIQLEVRSFNVTRRRDLCGFGVIESSFFGNVSNFWLNSYGKFSVATRRRFFAICENPEGGRRISPPPAVRGI